MKIIITGGLGFIGIALARNLILSGHDVLLLDSLSVQIHGELPVINVPVEAKVIRMDICDISERYDVIEGVDVVFHLASETGTGQSMYQMSHYTRVNCEGTSALLEAIAKCTHRPKQIILASSRSVYGEGAYAIADDPTVLVRAVARSREHLEAGRWEHMDDRGVPLIALPTPENLSYEPYSIYAATKAAQELLLGSASIALGVRTTIFRFQNVYGQGQSLRNPYTGIISIFYNRARQGLHIPVYEDGLESRDFVHISDIVSALETAIKSELPNRLILNVGSGIPTSVIHLANTLLKVSGLEVPVQVTGQYRIGDIRHCFADLTKVKKYLGYLPRMSLENGLREFCKWADSQPAHTDRTSQAESELRERGLTS